MPLGGDKVLVKTIDDPELTSIAQILSNSTARRIIKQLTKEISPSEISRREKLPLSTVSFHIERMVEAGLVEKTRSIAGERGRKKLYRLKFPSMLVLLSPNVQLTKSRVYTPFLLSIREIALVVLVASIAAPILAGLIAPLYQSAVPPAPLKPAAERSAQESPEAYTSPSANVTLQPLPLQPKPFSSPSPSSEYSPVSQAKLIAICALAFIVVSLFIVMGIILVKKLASKT